MDILPRSYLPLHPPMSHLVQVEASTKVVELFPNLAGPAGITVMATVVTDTSATQEDTEAGYMGDAFTNVDELDEDAWMEWVREHVEP